MNEDYKQFEAAVSRIAVEIGKAAAAEAMKSVSHERPSPDCQLVIERLMAGINRRLDSIETRLDAIQKDLDKALETVGEIESRVDALEVSVQELKQFKAMQLGAIKVMWTIIGSSGAAILGGVGLLIKHYLKGNP